MNEVVERVADAIEATTGTVGFSYREWVVLAARAAIEAMREPSPEMIAAGRESAIFGRGRSMSADIWSAMITAALADASPDIGKEG